MVPKSLPRGKPQVKHVYIQCLLIHWCGSPGVTPQSKEAGHPTIAPDSGAMTETRSEPIGREVWEAGQIPAYPTYDPDGASSSMEASQRG